MDGRSHTVRERRSHVTYAATLTTCEGTWLEQPPTEEEQQRIEAASHTIREYRRLAIEFHRDPTAANIFSLELFREKEFAPLHLNDRLIAQIIDRVGEPPVVEEADDPAFSTYLRQAVLSIASAQVRRALAEQLRRLLPHYVEAGEWKKAIAVDYNAFRTALGHEATPFLVQMTVEGLARWYETHDEVDDPVQTQS